MPDPIAPIEASPNGNISPNIDSELDAALSKSFTSNRSQSDAPVVENTPEPIEEKKPEVKNNSKTVKQEVKVEDNKKIEKPVENEKPLLTPEQVEKLDPKKQDGWTAIKNSNKRAHGIIEQKDSEIAKLKATLADKGSTSQKELNEIKAKMVELEKYRAMVDIQADPEFVSKYDQPVSKAIDGIKGMLKEMNVSDDIVNQIDFNNTKLLEEIVGHVSSNRDEFVARKLKRKIEDFLDLSDKRNETLSDNQKNYKETLEKRKQESFAKSAEGEGRMIKHIELKATELDKDGKPLIPFLAKMEAKENATPAEIEQVNNHNSVVDMMSQKLQGVLKMKEPEQQAEVAIAAVAAHYLMAQNRALTQQLKNAEAELQKISVVNTETPSRKPNNPTGRNGNSSKEYVDHNTALDNFFSRSR